MVSWKDSPTWRDRSVVPTPPPEDVAAYKKRGEIPYPQPRVHVVKHVYVGPRTSIAQGRKSNKKKNLIQKMFFSLPVGAELPIYYTHKQVPVSHKKSTVADSEVTDSEGSRYFSEETSGPFRSNTWGLQQPLENEELSPDLETRTIAKQNVLPSSEVYRRSKTPGLKMTRRDVSKTKKTSLLKQNNEFSKLENVGYITKDKNIKKSGLPKGNKRTTSRGSRNKINSEIENLLTKFLIVL